MEARAHIPVGPPVTNPLPSYWQDPKSPLANLIEPLADGANPMQPYDYAIIGSGISGTMIAYNILKRCPNARVVMLEAREICSGATGRNGGHTKAASYRSYLQHKEELGKEEALKIARMEYANIVATHEMAKDLGIECESEMCRTIDVIYDKGVFEAGCKAIEGLRADATKEELEEGKMAWYKIHTADAATLAKFHIAPTNTNPHVAQQENVAGLFEYTAGRIHAYRFTTAILKLCVQKGLHILTNTPVHSVQPLQSQTPLWVIFTPFNSFYSRNVVLATNGYTPYLYRDFQGAIVPMRGQITAQRPGPKNTLTTPLETTYSFIYCEGYEYMIPRPLANGEQHLIIGGGLGRLPENGASEFGTVDDSSLNPAISAYLHGSLAGYFGPTNWGESNEHDASQRVVQEWSGIMGATTDGRPFVGGVPGLKGLWVCAGFNGHGMVLCLKSAEAVVGMVIGNGELGADEGWRAWFPESFGMSRERMARVKGAFQGRKDMKVPA
jgi:glycine/D-amino acid oxidase-like deaminating enzyme